MKETTFGGLPLARAIKALLTLRGKVKANISELTKVCAGIFLALHSAKTYFKHFS